MSAPSGDPPSPDPKLMSAVMAAVQAFLDQEALSMPTAQATQGRAWKLAAWHPTFDMHLRRGLSWKGF